MLRVDFTHRQAHPKLFNSGTSRFEENILSLHEVYLFYSSQHGQWRIGTNYEGPKAAGCLIYINSKGNTFIFSSVLLSVL